MNGRGSGRASIAHAENLHLIPTVTLARAQSMIDSHECGRDPGENSYFILTSQCHGDFVAQITALNRGEVAVEYRLIARVEGTYFDCVNGFGSEEV